MKLEMNVPPNEELYLKHKDGIFLLGNCYGSAHHGGNVLTMVWEEIPTEQAQALGAQTQGPIYTEKLVEIDIS